MDAREFLRLRREGAIRDHDGTRTVVDRLCRHDLLHRVVPNGHLAAKLCLDNLFRIVSHDDEVATLIARPARELRGIPGSLIEPLRSN